MVHLKENSIVIEIENLPTNSFECWEQLSTNFVNVIWFLLSNHDIKPCDYDFYMFNKLHASMQILSNDWDTNNVLEQRIIKAENS